MGSEEAIATYLTDILEANDAGLLAAALGDIARARGMTEIAKSAGIAREALYKALRPGSEPRFDPVNRVCRSRRTSGRSGNAPGLTMKKVSHIGIRLGHGVKLFVRLILTASKLKELAMAKRAMDAESDLPVNEWLVSDQYIQVECEKLLAQMQTPRARRGVRKAFASTPEQLGAAAVWAANKDKKRA